MRLICALSIAFAIGATSAAQADEPKYVPRLVPPCKIYVVPKVGEVCGYADIEDWKTVLRIDAELVHSRTFLEQAKRHAENLASQIQTLQGQVHAYGESIKILTERNAKLTADLIALDRKYQDERVTPRWGSPVAWAIAAVSTAVLGGFLLAQL
jgi:hypothetical protein